MKEKQHKEKEGTKKEERKDKKMKEKRVFFFKFYIHYFNLVNIIILPFFLLTVDLKEMGCGAHGRKIGGTMQNVETTEG